MAKITKKPNKFVDSDHDGLSDWDEKYVYGSDPLDEDTNSDGINDGETVRFGFHPVTGQKLKDFFIPHEGNNYQPKSLEPRRVLFHIGTAFLIKLLVIVFVLAYPLSVWMSPNIVARQSQEIVMLTNQLRMNFDVDVLKRNSLLDESAYEKVQDMFINQYFAHRSPDLKGLKDFLKGAGYNYIVAGENLAIGFETPTGVMQAWQDSPTHYVNLVDPDFTEIGVAMAEDIFEDESTILIAQHFGKPTITSETQDIKSTKDLDLEIQSADFAEELNLEIQIQSEEIPDLIQPEVLSASETAIVETNVLIDQPAGKDESFVEVTAVLKPEVEKAVVNVLNNQIELEPTEDGTWQAQEIIYTQDEAVTTPASLITFDENGEAFSEELMVGSVRPLKSSMISQYLTLKKYPSSALKKIFEASSIYFKVLLVFAMVALGLNIFIEIKKQHLKLILPSVCLILVLSIFAIF